jgi:hypothetical protein
MLLSDQKSMPSEKQIAAARANGAKSRGPATLQGKRNSSRGGLRHGAYARTHLIAPKFQEFFNARLTGLTAEFRPETEKQQALVYLAATLLTRFYQLGADQERALNREVQRQLKLDPHATPETALAAAFVAFHLSSSAWLKVAECEHKMVTQFQGVIRLLLSLRRKRIATDPSKCNKTKEAKIESAPGNHKIFQNREVRTAASTVKTPTLHPAQPWHRCRGPD